MLKFDAEEMRKLIESIAPSLLIGHNGNFEEPIITSRIRMGPTGFNAKTTRNQYVERVSARPVTPKDKPITKSGNTTYYSKCQPKEDLLMFICVFLKYGNNLNKALRELKNSQTFRIKCMLYGIDTKTKHRKLQPNELSLTRIAMAFPIHTAVMILKMQHNGILQYSSFFKQELPLVMQHTVFPGLVPAEKFTEELKGITSILNMEISLIFHFKKRSLSVSYMDWMEVQMADHQLHETVEKLVESSAKYVDSAIKNGMEDGIKLKILTKAGILEVNTDGELELSAGTVALVNKLADIKALYSLRYCDAIQKLNSGE